MYRPAGAEDSDTDDDGFYMGSIHNMNDKFSMNGDINNTDHSRNSFVAMPAGAESDDEDSDGFEPGAAPANSMKAAAAKFNSTRTVNNDRQVGKTNEVTSNSLSETSGPGRGRGLLPQRGRGRGGFPRPPPSFNSKGKSPRRLIYCHKILPFCMFIVHQIWWSRMVI